MEYFCLEILEYLKALKYKIETQINDGTFNW